MNFRKRATLVYRRNSLWGVICSRNEVSASRMLSSVQQRRTSAQGKQLTQHFDQTSSAWRRTGEWLPAASSSCIATCCRWSPQRRRDACHQIGREIRFNSISHSSQRKVISSAPGSDSSGPNRAKRSILAAPHKSPASRKDQGQDLLLSYCGFARAVSERKISIRASPRSRMGKLGISRTCFT
jgi:hypothetical protein